MAMPSTAADGKVSRITMALKEGAGVTTTRSHTRYVVTEYGVADLFGQSFRERAKRLIAIAHPDFRDELAAFAKKVYGL
jgi:acyl-CoA hydrolase